MSLNAGFYLQQKLLSDHKSLREAEKCIEDILAVLRNAQNPRKVGTPHTLQSSLYSALHQVKTNVDHVSKFNSSCLSKFEKFVAEIAETPVVEILKKEDKKVSQVIETLITAWLLTEKLNTWMKKYFKHLPTDVSFNQHANESILNFFKEKVLEKTKVKDFVEQYGIDVLRETEKQPTTAEIQLPVATPESHEEAVKNFEILIKMLVAMDYRASSFEDPFKTMSAKYFGIAEEKRKQEKAQELQQQQGTIGGVATYSHSHSVTYAPAKPSNPYPEKSASGHVGLRNQGATCYLNSVIQSMFASKAFRRLIFQWRYKPEVHGQNQAKCIPLQIQKLFARLRFSEERAVETTDLTASFGWTRADSFVQHDAQELLRVLFDALETQIPIDQLFRGSYRDYIICSQCRNVGGRRETFLDLQLVIRDLKHLDQAFDNYQFEEMLEGENQYKCEKCQKKVDAYKGIKLDKLPDILTLHLKRFDLDYQTLTNIKLNNKIIFPLRLDMNKHLNSAIAGETSTSQQWNPENIYNLFAIQIHSGGAGGGHYYAYIRDKSSWYEFNDSSVSSISEHDLEKAFGNDGSVSNAYMLWYMRERPVAEIHKSLSQIREDEEFSLLPEDIQKLILEENEKVYKGRKDFHLSDTKVDLDVYYNNKKHSISVEKAKTVKDFVAQALETIITETKVDPSLARLRKYNTAKKVIGSLVSDSKLVEEIAVNHRGFSNSFALEVREATQEFSTVGETDLCIRISKYNSESKKFDAEVCIYLNGTSSVKDLKSSIQAVTGIPAEKQCIIRQYCSSYSNQWIFEIYEDDAKVLEKDLKLADSELLYVDSFPEEEGATPNVFAFLKDELNKININYKIPNDLLGKNEKGETSSSIHMDKSATITDLKRAISTKIGVPAEDFKLHADDTEKSYVYDLASPLSTLCNNTVVYVRKGKQLESNQYTVTVYNFTRPKPVLASELEEKRRLAEAEAMMDMKYENNHAPQERDHRRYGASILDPMLRPFERSRKRFRAGMDEALEYGSALTSLFDVQHHNHRWHYERHDTPYERVKLQDMEDISFSNRNGESDVFKKMGTFIIKKEATTAELKQLLLKEAVSLGINTEKIVDIRLREKIPGRNVPGKILLANERPIDAIASSTSARDIAVEVIEAPEQLSENDMIVRVARFHPSQWTLGISEEVIIQKSMTLDELKHFLSLKSSIPDVQLEVTKVSYQMAYQLKHTSTMTSLSWLHNQLTGTSVITREPWFLKDGDLLIYKDGAELDYFTLNPKAESKSDSSKNDGKEDHRDKANGSSGKQPAAQSSYKRKEVGVRFFSQQDETPAQEKAGSDQKKEESQEGSNGENVKQEVTEKTIVLSNSSNAVTPEQAPSN